MSWHPKDGLLNGTLEGDEPLPDHIVAHFDGLCEPRNPGGVATVAWAILPGINEKPLRQFYGVLADGGRRATNNWAEYTAFGTLLRYLAENWRGISVEIYGDSALVIKQFNYEWAVNAPHLIELNRRCQELAQQIQLRSNLQACWLPREENMAADGLSEQAFFDYVRKHKPYYEKQFHRVKEERRKKKEEKRG